MEAVEARVGWYPTPSGGELAVEGLPRPPFVGLRALHPRADALMELDGEGGEETGNVVGVVVRWFLFFEAWEAVPETGKLWRQVPRHRTHPREALPLVELLRHKQARLRERAERDRLRSEGIAKKRRGERSAAEVHLRSLEARAAGIPELDEEWPDLHEFEREEIDFEWAIDTGQLFGALEDLDRGVSPWGDDRRSLTPEQAERYAAVKRAFREAVPTVERLGLSKGAIPLEAGGERDYSRDLGTA